MQEASRRRSRRCAQAVFVAPASHRGSGEHKGRRWWGGLPEARQLLGGKVGRRGKQQTTLCPLTTDEDRDRATDWVRQAIAKG